MDEIRNSSSTLDHAASHEPNPQEHRDPITGAPGAHPMGTGLGALIGGAVAGAVVAAAAAPAVAAVAAVGAVGAIVGGFAGKGVAESVDPTAVEAYSYWNEQYLERPYVNRDYDFQDYGPAYVYGASAYTRYPGQRFDAVETELARDWARERAASRLEWEQARLAARDAWLRMIERNEGRTPVI